MQNTTLCFLFLCLHIRLFLYSTQTKASLNTPLHTRQKTIWSSEGWKKHPCPLPTSTEVLSHLCDSIHKCSTLAFFAILTRTWQKIFCCVNSEMGPRPSGDHTSVIPATFLQNNPKNEEKNLKCEPLNSCDWSMLHYVTIVHSDFCFFETIAHANNLHLLGKKWLWKLQELSCMWVSTQRAPHTACCKHHGIYLTPIKHSPLPQTDRKL